MTDRTFVTSLRSMIFFLCFIHMIFCVLVKANSDSVKSDSSLKKEPSNSDDYNSLVFKATDEWQEVRKGQPIPKGLHVRINFETGKTEAKKLDAVVTKNTAVTVVKEEVGLEIEENGLSDDGPILNQDFLHNVMRNINGDDPKEQAASKAPEETTIFKTYDELKQAMSEMDLLMTTDMEMLADLISKFPATSLNTAERIAILTDLEYLVHQFDNAVEFDRLGGFSVVVYPSFNASDVAVRSAAVRLLGSAVQSNPQVQTGAVSTGSVQLLLRTLLYDTDAATRSCALYALSCLVRRCPEAQLKMVREGGLTVLADVFDRKENAKLQIKVVTLLYDLLQEKQLTDSVAGLDLESKLLESEWCERIPKLLASETSKPDNDVVEKVTNAMLALVSACNQHFNTSKVRTMLLKLEVWYNEVVRSDPDEYFMGLANVLRNLLIRLKPINVEL